MTPFEHKRLFSATINPLSIAVVAIGITTLALSGVLWILPLTVVALGLVVFAQWRQTPAPSIEDLLPPAYARREQTLHALMDRINQSLESSTPTVRGCLETVPGQILQVRDKVRSLLRQQARMDAYLAEATAQQGANEIARLEQALAHARTEAARQNYSSALENKRRDLEAREDLRASSERVGAELVEIETALQSTLSRVVSLGTTQDSSDTGEGITNDLDEVLLTIQSLEQALSEVQDPTHRRIRT